MLQAAPAPRDAAPAPAALRGTQALALAGLVGLIVLGLSWELWLAPTGKRTLAVKVLPLLLGLPGLWRGRLYTFRWLSLAVWLYFAEGVVRAWGDRGVSAACAGLEIAFSLLLFTACALHVRRALRLNRGVA